ncbi:MAG: cobalt-precorrin 5A hydrolase [Clostridiales bacterium]|nr:cobalt-precorrin 5A hydrolase [Clostridiales bacterium]
MRKKEIAVIFFTEQGARLAGRVWDALAEYDEKMPCRSLAEGQADSARVVLYSRIGAQNRQSEDAVAVRESLHDWCAKVFPAADAILFIGAAGIAVRTIAPFLVSKTTDPAVLAADERGNHVISLLSGHLGGGNELTLFLADRLGADPVITTASDVGGKLAVDVWAQKNNLYITDLQAAKRVAARIVGGEAVAFYCEDDGKVRGTFPAEFFWLTPADPSRLSRTEPEEGKSSEGKDSAHPKEMCLSAAVIVSVFNDAVIRDISGEAKSLYHPAEESEEDIPTLHLVPRAVVLGVGCKRGKSFEEIRDFVCGVLRENHISPHSICAVASIDRKADEPGLAALAGEFGVPFETFSAETLQAVPGEYSASDFVAAVTGADNVCERAAMAALTEEEQQSARFLCRKTAGNGVTAALLERPWEVSFE